MERAVVEVPEASAPLPRCAGLEYRRQQDNAIRFGKLRRRKKLIDSEQRELQRLGQDRVATPSVAMFSNDDAA
jgi:hypothetical protein